MPCEPTNDNEMKELKDKIKEGVYNMVDEIVPQTFKKFQIKDGECEIVDVVVSERKHPLLYLRNEMMEQHNDYVRLFSDNEYNEMSEENIKKELKIINEFDNVKNLTPIEKLHTLKVYQRTRDIMLWHDTSTISDHSYLLMMVKCVYHPAIFANDG